MDWGAEMRLTIRLSLWPECLDVHISLDVHTSKHEGQHVDPRRRLLMSFGALSAERRLHNHFSLFVRHGRPVLG
jgi:hypothetical protein